MFNPKQRQRLSSLFLAVGLLAVAAVLAGSSAGGADARSKRADPDHDGLPTRFELRRSHTKPHRADSDRDGLKDGFEVHKSKTNPRKFDTDGDGFGDGAELRAGTNPRRARSHPKGNKAASGKDAASNSGGSASSPVPTNPAPPVSTVPPPPPPPPSACALGATKVTTASALLSAIGAKQSACVTAAVGDVTVSGKGDRTGVVVSTEGAGSIEELEIVSTTGLTVRGARLRSVTIRDSDRTVIEASTIGGTQANRVDDQLIFMPDESNDVIIRSNDIGWTVADDSGNTGYGCRCYGETNNLQFVGNVVHDIAADGFQGTNGSNVVIAYNKIGPVGANPGSSEHSVNIQIVNNGPGLQIVNNWIYAQGYYEGQAVANSGSMYIHGDDGDSGDSMLIENNFVDIARGRTEICGLGTGGTSRSNITIRRNTWLEGGQTFNSFPGFEWDCDSGSGNLVEGNIAVDPDGGFAQDGSSAAATFANNLWGKPALVTLDGAGNCISANCNPSGQPPIGYRKPAGAPW